MNQPTPGMLVTPSVRLVRCMSGGAMGSVWLAEHTGLETQVVVKFIAQEVASSPDVVQRFAREAAAASRVKSPHVVQMLDHGITDGHPYIIMELLEGRDLQQRVREQRRLPPHEVATIIGQLAKALARAHERGVLHRDIKPSNVFLCDVGNNEIFVKLLDFGVAKTLNGPDLDTTKAGAILGTPFFMSPEQLAAGDVDHRSDLWALGVLSFMLLTGKRPFRGDSISALALAVHMHEHPVPSALAPSLPRGFDDWFKKACARERAQRFQSARKLAEALYVALEIPNAMNVNATDSYPAMVAAGSPAPSDAPSVPGLLGNSAYNYATATDAPPRSKRRAAIMLAAGVFAVVIGFAVLRTRTAPPPVAAPAAAPQKVEEPKAVEKPAEPAPVPSTSASDAAKAVAKPTKVKPKALPVAKADDPFGDSRH
jgi:eukaryotic-like serine/threonine-protein kinase